MTFTPKVLANLSPGLRFGYPGINQASLNNRNSEGVAWLGFARLTVGKYHSVVMIAFARELLRPWTMKVIFWSP